jgi:hypothetical protein
MAKPQVIKKKVVEENISEVSHEKFRDSFKPEPVEEPVIPIKPKEEFTIAELAEKVNVAAFSSQEPINNTIVDKDHPDYVPKGHNPMMESMIENDSDMNRGGTQPQVNPKNVPPQQPKDFSEPIIDSSETQHDPEKDKKAPPVMEGFDKLSASEKRHQVEMFADALLTTYSLLLPEIPTMVVSYNMNKMELLDKQGEIRLSMVVSKNEDGDLTIREVLNNFNSEVEQVFVVTEEMKNELRVPLIMVLEDKGIAPTPGVSLAIGIGRHLFMFVMATIQLNRRKQSDMVAFKEFRREEMEIQRMGDIKKPAPAQPEQPTPTPVPEPEPTITIEDVVVEEEKFEKKSVQKNKK